MKIGWTPKSLRAFKRLIRKNPNLRSLIEHHPFIEILLTELLSPQPLNIKRN
ncbi:hypothetical protein [Nostoc sp. C110]|uniref:hypothetical protein n=1 Tax=Nostoc sp. C110 TaxID=3349876 RepID=UPI00370DDD14